MCQEYAAITFHKKLIPFIQTEFVMTTHDTVHLALVSMLNTLAVYFNIYLIVAIELRFRI